MRALIGISAAGMYGQLTTGHPVRVKSKPGKRAKAWGYTIRIDTAKNNPVFTDEEIEWEGKQQGTRVEIDLEGEFRRGQRSVGEFLKLVAVANPHVRLTFIDPDGEKVEYERATDELPAETTLLVDVSSEAIDVELCREARPAANVQRRSQ